MQNYFFELCRKLFDILKPAEVLMCSFYAEQSDFVRFNHDLIRQAGHVDQSEFQLIFIKDNRQLSASYSLSGDLGTDYAYLKQMLTNLRLHIEFLPIDPFIHYSTAIHSTEQITVNKLPSATETVADIMLHAKDSDLTGFWASGPIMRGFSNSIGQQNWHECHTFNFDWSVYLQQDKAVKMNYAGESWQESTLLTKMATVKHFLTHMDQSAKTLNPGTYRAYLAPSAFAEILSLVMGGAFSRKNKETAQSPLLKMFKEGWLFDKNINFVETGHSTLNPDFTPYGFIKPAQISLINQGQFDQCLVNARSAKEYQDTVNCDAESPVALEMSGGDLPQEEVLTALDRGLYINHLWYCNYSDRNHCRITGMTRFACFWVENGKIVAPINVMRFDDTLYRLLGEHLLAMTAQREVIMDTSTYGRRSTDCYLLPGILVDNFNLTL